MARREGGKLDRLTACWELGIHRGLKLYPSLKMIIHASRYSQSLRRREIPFIAVEEESSLS